MSAATALKIRPEALIEREFQRARKQKGRVRDYELLSVLTRAQVNASTDLQNEILTSILASSAEIMSKIKAVVQYNRAATPEQRRWAFDQLLSFADRAQFHYFISFAAKEPLEKVSIVIKDEIRAILNQINRKEFIAVANEYATTSRNPTSRQLFFDIACTSENFEKIAKKQKVAWVEQFLDQNDLDLIDAFEEVGADILIDILKKTKNETLKGRAIQFLGESSDNENFEDLFLKMLKTEKTEKLRINIYQAFSNMIDIRNKKALFENIEHEQGIECLRLLLELVQKYRETSQTAAIIKLLDHQNDPTLVVQIIGTLCSFETKRSFQVIKKAFQNGQRSASKVLIYKGYDFKQVEVRNLLKTSTKDEINDFIAHIFRIFATEKQERPLLANLYNLFEIFWFDRSTETFNETVAAFTDVTEYEDSFKLVLRHLINIINVNEKPLSTVATIFICEFSKHYFDHMKATQGNLRLHNHIYTQLMSLNLASNSVIRLILLNYYSHFKEEDNLTHNNKVIRRYGFTILEYIFEQFSSTRRKQQAALAYFYQNFTIFLDALDNDMHILSESLKQFMYKHPQEFNQFLEKYFTIERIRELKAGPEEVREQLKVHLCFLMGRSIDVCMRKSLTAITTVVANLYEVQSLAEMEQLIAMTIPPKFHNVIVSKTKKANTRQRARNKALAERADQETQTSEAIVETPNNYLNMPIFTQIIELIE